MDSSATRIEQFHELREKLGGAGFTEKARTNFSAYSGGFTIGSVIEIVGPAKTEVLALFLKEHPEMRVAWIESRLTINPYALFQKGANLRNILFIEARDQVNWCLSQALEAGCFEVIIADGNSFSERELRRYQLLAERRHAHFFLLSQQTHSSWVPHLQIEAKKFGEGDAGVHLHVLRRRGI